MSKQHPIRHLIAIWETVPEPDPKAVEKAFLMLFAQVAVNEMPLERARNSADLTNPDDPLMCERQPLLTTSPND